MQHEYVEKQGKKKKISFRNYNLNHKYEIRADFCFTNLREVPQHFRHLITTFPTTNVDDNVAVGVLGQ